MLSLDESRISLDGTLDDGQSHQKSSHTQLTISMFEVYNETVYDLLTPTRKPVSSKNALGGGKSIKDDVHGLDMGDKGQGKNINV